MSRYEFLVLTSPSAGTDTEFNRWYDEQHLRDVISVPGFVSARRYRVLTSAQGLSGAKPPEWKYVAIYNMECDDPEKTLAELLKRAGTALMPLSETLNIDTAATFLLKEISSASN